MLFRHKWAELIVRQSIIFAFWFPWIAEKPGILASRFVEFRRKRLCQHFEMLISFGNFGYVHFVQCDAFFFEDVMLCLFSCDILPLIFFKHSMQEIKRERFLLLRRITIFSLLLRCASGRSSTQSSEDCIHEVGEFMGSYPCVSTRRSPESVKKCVYDLIYTMSWTDTLVWVYEDKFTVKKSAIMPWLTHYHGVIPLSEQKQVDSRLDTLQIGYVDSSSWHLCIVCAEGGWLTSRHTTNWVTSTAAHGFSVLYELKEADSQLGTL